VQEIAKECRRGFRSNGDKESANTKRRRDHCPYSDRKSTNVEFHDSRPRAKTLTPIFIAQLMLMALILALAVPALPGSAAASS